MTDFELAVLFLIFLIFSWVIVPGSWLNPSQSHARDLLERAVDGECRYLRIFCVH
jgi:hypothetical protein